jgi:CHASE2 domain-containing sensor protein
LFKSHRYLIVILSAVMLAGTYHTRVQSLEGLAYDLYSFLLPAMEKPSNTAVIAIDQRAMTELGKWPWSRNDLANLVMHIHADGPRALGIMLPLDQPQMLKDPRNFEKQLAGVNKKLRSEIENVLKKLDPDPVFSAALNKNKNVILSMPYWPEFKNGETQTTNALQDFIKPFKTLPPVSMLANPYLQPLLKQPPNKIIIGRAPMKEFYDVSAGIGLSQQGQSGGTVRKESLIIPWQDQYFASFLLQLYAHRQGKNIDAVSVTPGESAVLKSRVIKLGLGNAIYPRTRPGDDKAVAVYSAADVMNGQINKKTLSGKTVIIGFNEPGFTSQLHGPAGTRFTPASWAAHSLDALINNSVVKVPAWSLGLQRGMLLVLAVYLLLLPTRMRGRLGLIVSMVIGLVLLNVSLIMLITQGMWLMLALPALFIVVGHIIITLYHHVATLIRDMRNETSQAYIKLGSFHQAQGKLDEALDYYEKCALNDALMEPLYKLALDYERRRQFSKASGVYDMMARHDANFRDIKDRRERHSTLPSGNAVFTGTSPNMAATIVMDDPKVERPVLGRYQLERELGRGAMGMVYLGKDPTIGRTVAIKTMALSEEFEDEYVEEVRRRFFVEAETAGRLNHPNIVTIYDAGEEHDLAYIAMDYIKGEPLNNYARPGNLLPIATVFAIGVRVSDALDYAHKQNVVHRDVKPGNIIYDTEHDTLKITDFGIACLTDNSKTRSGTVLGSPSYMSPEQLQGVKVDGRSDIYSLGVTLYQLFTGELPFQADSMAALAYKIIHEKPQSIRKLRSELPACLTRIINKAMDKDPKNRYQDGNSLAEALRRCLG